MNNKQRAEQALKLVDGYSGAEDLESDIVDLLCGLIHLSDLKGFDFEHYLNCAYGHYRYEIDPANFEETQTE